MNMALNKGFLQFCFKFLQWFASVFPPFFADMMNSQEPDFFKGCQYWRGVHAFFVNNYPGIFSAYVYTAMSLNYNLLSRNWQICPYRILCCCVA